MSRFQTALVILVSITVLYLAQAVFIPLVLAAFLAMLLTGPVLKLQKWRVPKAAAVVSVVVLATALIAGIGWLVFTQVVNLAGNVESYQAEIVAKSQRVRGSGGGITSTIDRLKKVQEAVQTDAGPASQPSGTQPATNPSADTQPAPLPAGVDKTARAVTPSDPLREGSSPGGRLRDALVAPAAPTSRPAHAAGTQPNGTEASPIWTYAITPPPSQVKSMFEYLGLAMGPFGTAGIVLVFVLFMLLEREDLRDRAIRLVSNGRYTVTTTAVDDGITRVMKFMRAQAIVNGTYGLAVAIGLCVISLTLDGKHEVFPSFLIWGLLACVLRFVPYVGPWIAAAFPIIVSLAAFHGFTVFFAVLGMFLVIELLSNNVMEPMLYGATTGLSTMAILVSAVFWTWLWGPIGLVLATPLTVVLMVLGKHAPPLKFLEVLLGDRPAMEPPERVYQRLLAGDEDEAFAVADDYEEKNGLAKAYDDVLLPALYMAEQDDAQGLLDDERSECVMSGLRRIIDSLGQDALDAKTKVATAASVAVVAAAAGGTGPAASADDEARSAAAAGPQAARPQSAGAASIAMPDGAATSGVRVSVLPAQDEADELAGLMLAHVLRLEGVDARAVSHNALAAEMMDAVTAFDPHAVCISAMPPAAISHVRYLLRRLTGKLPKDRLTIGVWKAQSDLETMKRRLDVKDASMSLVLADAVTSIHKLTENVRAMPVG